MRVLLLFAAGALAWAGAAPRPQLPLSFEPNRGQFDASIRFAARGPGYRVALTGDGAEFVSRRARTSWRFVDARPVSIAGDRPLAGVANYLLGAREHWVRRVPTFGAVRYTGLWEGIDLVYYGNAGRLEYDLIVAPGADPGAVAIRFDGPVSITGGGALLAGGLRFEPPFAHQESRPVEARYRIRDGAVTFELGRYDKARPLVIDPVLAYSSLLGGNDIDLGNGLVADAAENVYVVGNTDSRNFPATSGTPRGDTDIFVAKLSRTGALVYATFIGGSGADRGRNIAIDAGGRAFVAGETDSTDFPVSASALQRTYRGGDFDAFAFMLNASGADFSYSTYLGGSGEDSAYGVKIDGLGNAFVSGVTASTNFPVTNGALRAAFAGGAYDLFVLKLNPAGTALAYSTYLGGSGRDATDANLAIDASGNAYVTGETVSVDFPTTAGAFQITASGPSDAFVAKLNPAGTALVYSTRLGGGQEDSGLGIAVDGAGAAYVCGTTFSPNFPILGGPVQPRFGGGDSDGFVTKLNAAGTTALYSTYLGGSESEDAWAIAVDAAGVASVVGTTVSPDFPVTQDALQTSYGGDGDAFFARLNAAGTALAYSTYIGWTGFDEGFNVALGPAGNAYITGAVDPGFPTTPGVAGARHGGGDGDAFIARLAETADGIEAPRFGAQDIANTASFVRGAVAPGEMVTILGQNLGPQSTLELKLNAAGRVDTNLGVTRVLFDTIEAPLIHALATQVTAVVPYEIAGRPAVNVTVVHRGIRSNTVNVPVVEAAPGIFTQNSQGFGQGSIRNEDYSINTPSNPAARGSVVQIYATGAGLVTPPAATGSVPSAGSMQNLPVRVMIGGIQAEVLYAGNAPALVAGVLQVNARVPADVVPAAGIPVFISAGGQFSQANVTMAIQ